LIDMMHNGICVIGAGNWGQNHIRTLDELGQLGGVVEPDQSKRNIINDKYDDLLLFSRIEEALQQNFEGYVVATPSETHVSILKKILPHKIPVLVEKPLALSIADAVIIQKLVQKHGTKLLVGHLLLFHPAICKMKALVDAGEIGDLQYLYSNRLNLGTVRQEENVFWSFAPHDISLFQYFTGAFPKKVNSSGGAFLQPGIHDTTMTYLEYENGIQGHIYVSWLHPFKEHRLVLIGSKGMLHFDDSHESKPLLLYEKGFKIDNGIAVKYDGPAKKIKFDNKLPLTEELKYFINAVQGSTIEKADINNGLEVVKILEMATDSLRSGKSVFS